MQFCKQLSCCARKIAKKVASKSNFGWIFIAWIFIARNFISQWVLDFHWGRVWHALWTLSFLKDYLKDLKVRYLNSCSVCSANNVIIIYFQSCVVKTIHIFLTLNKLNNIISTIKDENNSPLNDSVSDWENLHSILYKSYVKVEV